MHLLNVLKKKATGATVHITITKNNADKPVDIQLGTRYEKSFKITRMANPDALQQAIYKSWMGE
jgi:hypothetical protein